MSNIDWSKAPEGATHWTPAANVCCPFLKNEGKDWSWWTDQRWVEFSGHSWIDQLVGAVARPDDWTGEGLPPVGTVCEVFNNELSFPHWERCTILYSGTHRMLYDSESCSERAGYIESLLFRTLPTPEQIAAEARVEAAQAWLKGIELEYGEEVADKCEAILLEAEDRKKHDNHKPDFPKDELQSSSEIHQANCELHEWRLRRLAEICRGCAVMSLHDRDTLKNVASEIEDILSHYRSPQA